MGWDSLHSDDAFRVAEGTIAVALLMGAFVAEAFDFYHYAKTEGEYSDQLFALSLSTLLHMFGVLLLFDLAYGKDPHAKHHRQPPVTTLSVALADMATISDVTTAQSEDLHHSSEDDEDDNDCDSRKRTGVKKDNNHRKMNHIDNDATHYISMTSLSTSVDGSGSYEDALDSGAALECVFGFSIPLAYFCVCSLLVSSMLLLSSLTQQITMQDLPNEGSSSTWIRIAYLVTYGIFVSSAGLSYFKILSESCDAPLLQSRLLKMCLSGAFAIAMIGVLSAASYTRESFINQLGPFSGKDSQQPAYLGEAWVIDSFAVDETKYCRDFSDAILVNLTVVYGGDWACPDNPDQWCEVPLTTKLECSYIEYTSQVEGEIEGERETYSTPDYVYFRYHDYGVDDDEAYDYKEQPSFHSWNRPAEDIIGSCSDTCTVQTELWLLETRQGAIRSSYVLYLSLGASLCFVGWPLLELFRATRCR